MRLLWPLDPRELPLPWLPADTPTPSRATQEQLLTVPARQQRDEGLAGGRLRSLPRWVPGLPDAPDFAHKTGSTDNDAADAGIVASGRRHYDMAVLTNLCRRFAPHDGCATTWRLPALGTAIDAWLAPGAA